MNKCPNCGKENKITDSEIYCEYCGNVYEDEGEYEDSEYEE